MAPAPDVLGHFVLPVAMAAGALVDIATRGHGVPSVLALAFAASHLRIATRDWPFRRHYFAGVVAGAISAVHSMTVTHAQALDWAVLFLLLASASMLIEGLCDLRLVRSNTQDFCGRRHADAI